MAAIVGDTAHAFVVPHKMIYGSGALAAAAPVLASMGKKALVVTDGMMVKLGNLDHLTGTLAGVGVAYAVYDGVNSEPVDGMVVEGARRFVGEGCDFIVALGGGSPIDACKAIALVVQTGEPIASFMERGYDRPVCPIAAIPTTAGTGSEATQFTIITDTENDVKMLISSASLIPRLAIVDPLFTMTAPASVTAATGVDALCHAIESYTSRKAQPLSETFSLSATKRIFGNLATCVHEPDNEAARIQMSLAATEAGIAFNNASVTIIHGMSRPIGALFHVPHGLSNAILMGPCLAFALDGDYRRFARIARYCGLSHALDDERAAHDLLDAINALLKEISIPSLVDARVDPVEFRLAIDKMAADAQASGSPANTIKPVSIEDMKAIYLGLCS